MNFERPLDLLNSFKGKEVWINLKKSEESFKGVLLSFDIHINLAVMVKEKYVFVRGENVKSVEEVAK